AGRHLLPDAHDAAAALVAFLRERAPGADVIPVGSLRRGCETCGDLDILASGADGGLMDGFVGYRLVERTLARGETKSSGLLRGDLHIHTTATDGKDDVLTMAAAARDAGLDYIAITDHSQALAMANGLDERRALDHAARIRALDGAAGGVRLLAGIECDIRSD